MNEYRTHSRVIKVLLLIGVISICIYYFLQVHRPITIASDISGLEIKPCAEVVYFQEYYNLIGGYVKVILKVSPENATLIEKQVKRENYVPLKQPIIETFSYKPSTLPTTYPVAKNKIGENPSDFLEIIWDRENRLLYCVEFL